MKYKTYDVGIHGNYATGNIGDMAIGKAFKNEFKKEKLDFKLFNKNIGETKSSNTILGGGGVIHDHVAGSLEKKMSFLQGNNFLIGIGYQNISDKKKMDDFFSIVNSAELVTVRDAKSHKKMSKEAGREINLTSCPAFCLEVPKVEEKNITGINFRPWFGLGAYGDANILHKHFNYPRNFNIESAQEIYINNINKIIDSVENPTFIPFDLSDYFFAKKYLDIPVYNYYPSVSATLKRIAECKQVVATRYHSNVFSILCNKPLLSIAYAPKVEELAKRSGVKPFYPHKSINSIEFYRPKNRDQIIQASRENFDLLFDRLIINK